MSTSPARLLRSPLAIRRATRSCRRRDLLGLGHGSTPWRVLWWSALWACVVGCGWGGAALVGVGGKRDAAGRGGKDRPADGEEGGW